MALEDAIILATALKTSGLKGIPVYEHTRRARVEKIVNAGACSSSVRIPGPPAAASKNTMLRIVFRYIATQKSIAWITGYHLPR